VHSSDQYEYDIFIESVSGIGGGVEPAIQGVYVTLNRQNVGNHHILSVIPSMRSICIILSNGSSISYPDSANITIEQLIYNKNVPFAPYSTGFTINEFALGDSTCTLQNYPMGLWHIKIGKSKGGIQTFEEDSIYLDWWQTKTYTIDW